MVRNKNALRDILSLPELVLFDVDMTLIDNQAHHLYAREQFVSRLVNEGYTSNSNVNSLLSDLHKPISCFYELHLKHSRLTAEKTAAMFSECFDGFPFDSRVYNGAVETIMYLKKDRKLIGVVSSAHSSLLRSNASKLNERFGRLHGQGYIFDVLVGEEIGFVNKPKFGAYRRVIAMLGDKYKHRAEKPTVYFGDSQSDIDFCQAMNENGVQCHFIWISGENPTVDFSDKAALTYRNMEEVYLQLIA